MYSGVFGITPELTADLIAGFVQGRLEPVEVDVIDLDEERYRGDQWAVRAYCKALTPYEPSLLPMAKALIDEEGDAAVRMHCRSPVRTHAVITGHYVRARTGNDRAGDCHAPGIGEDSAWY